MSSTPAHPPEAAPALSPGQALETGGAGRRRTWRGWLPGVLVAAIGAVLLTAWGVSAAELVRYTAYWTAIIALPGVVAWRVLGPRLRYGIEDMAAGVCLGYAMETVARIIASTAGLPTRLGDAAPLTLALLGLAVPGVRNRVGRPWLSLPLTIAWAYAALLGLVFVWFAFGFFARQPLSWSGRGGPENDLLFALALAGEATHRWPLEFPWVQGEPLLYHWFFAEHLGSAREMSGVQLPTLVLRLELLPAAVLVLLTTGAIATRMVKRSWAGPLAAVLLFLVQDASPITWKAGCPADGRPDGGTLRRQLLVEHERGLCGCHIRPARDRPGRRCPARSPSRNLGTPAFSPRGWRGCQSLHRAGGPGRDRMGDPELLVVGAAHPSTCNGGVARSLCRLHRGLAVGLWRAPAGS